MGPLACIAHISDVTITITTLSDHSFLSFCNGYVIAPLHLPNIMPHNTFLVLLRPLLTKLPSSQFLEICHRIALLTIKRQFFLPVFILLHPSPSLPRHLYLRRNTHSLIVLGTLRSATNIIYMSSMLGSSLSTLLKMQYKYLLRCKKSANVVFEDKRLIDLLYNRSSSRFWQEFFPHTTPFPLQDLYAWTWYPLTYTLFSKKRAAI
ncbi:hypothetical protein O6H91_05G130500 [Diphasiastrum complanatum]|uniref:Uncharacterized protein n=1 Tax=Diphasiastrum complanatum TaxID=34168 RepID=A0ACC2DTI7_DIPCM|nr:hypothetical protein O6H91_05G130500 [Diphasiastrum complanatum]